jgi:hypothetical protein
MPSVSQSRVGPEEGHVLRSELSAYTPDWPFPLHPVAVWASDTRVVDITTPNIIIIPEILQVIFYNFSELAI